jgi:hypothetical protein
LLVLVGSLYALYLVYLGLPVLMKNPPEKSVAYLVVAAIVGIIGSVLISMANSIFMPSPLSGMHGMNDAPDIQISTPKGDVKIVAESIQDMAKRLEALAAEQEKAAKK